MLFLFLDFIGLSFNLKQLTGLLDLNKQDNWIYWIFLFSSYQCVVLVVVVSFCHGNYGRARSNR